MTTPRSADKTSNHFNSNSCGVSCALIYFPSLQWVWDAGYKSQMEIGGVPLVHLKMYNIPSCFYGGWLIWLFYGISSVFSVHAICLSWVPPNEGDECAKFNCKHQETIVRFHNWLTSLRGKSYYAFFYLLCITRLTISHRNQRFILRYPGWSLSTCLENGAFGRGQDFKSFFFHLSCVEKADIEKQGVAFYDSEGREEQ